MKDSNLKVSVIIPVFNGEQFIQNAVESCLDQNEVNEIILIDDGSTDKTNEICIQLSNQFNKVKFFTHEYRKNKGPGLSRNLGIEKSKNDCLNFFSDIDVELKNIDNILN